MLDNLAKLCEAMGSSRRLLRLAFGPAGTSERWEHDGEAPSIVGTAWSLLGQGKLVISFHFEANGTFIYRNPIKATRSTWTQTGDCIRFDG